MKKITFSDEARDKLKRGVDLIANAVKVTLGPRGRNMIYGFHYGYPICTKDGVTVARQVESRDQTEQLGLLLVRQAAQKTADDVGDGTTTASLLVQEIFSEGLKALSSGANPILIKRGIEAAVMDAVNFIDSIRVKVGLGSPELVRVATLSANNDPTIGKLIVEAVEKVGDDGVVTIEDNYNSPDTLVETITGMQLNEGLVSPYFVTDPTKMEAVYSNPYILIYDGELYNIKQIKSIVEKALGTGRPIVIVCNNIHQIVLQGIISARVKDGINIAIVKSPYFGDMRTEQLTDLSILTGATLFGPAAANLELADVKDLGQCESFRATKSFATYMGGAGDKIFVSSRIELIRETIAKSESDYEKHKLQERLSKLTTGVAVIKVGAPTEVDQKEKKMRVEDALLATKAAIEGGIVPGGGVTFLNAIEHIEETGDEEELIGRRIVKRSLRAPIKQIAYNAGLEGAEIIANILSTHDTGFGYNFLTNEYGDLMKLGVIDPARVVRTALINAANIAGTLLTTEVVCNEEEEAEVTRTPKPKSQ